MSLISGPGLHRLPSRLQLAADLKAVNRQKDAATVAAIKYATEATELQQQLDEAGITISGLLEDLETARKEGIRLQSALDNATSRSIPATFDRDIWPGEEPTHPIDVSEIRARHGSADPAAYVPMRLAPEVKAGLL
ncbi:hypothetical protein OG592_27305 [Streptomyces avidinii]|uniref:hypothetical protein n=1 Tax=Streptomyces avidinii TaxID=1895 RepID=UPI00386B3A30|nr:hypothetical protein OG592_27305 [Streptomyces avidinii]